MSKSLNILVKNIERFAQGSNYFQISKASGVPSSTFSRIINKQTNPNLETIDKIAASLNVEPFELIKESAKEKIDIPADILSMLKGQPDTVYDTIRVMLKALNKSDIKKSL